ncbi:hypothetical protein [Gilliamella apis]|uniref:IS1595 family transposase n=1 Tax=Gilliamella apis TaxID=1970738 RepID=A0A242NSL8_9GAMM|nr:hypothetical protein [Gilliamella apis]OTQ48335.1 hypothetical protein B6D06_10655 [Gilliamella apis]
MYHSLLPIEQHLAAERFLLALPDLVATTPLCRRFKPASLFINIAPMTLSNQPHSFIADNFNLSPRAARRRDNVIRQLLSEHEPDLYQAILNLAQTKPTEVFQQANAFKTWLTELLNTALMPCDYCHSLNTIRIGHRLNFRCKTCRRTFNPLKKYQLNKLSHHERWLPFIDLLLQGETYKTIQQQLGINANTAAKWQRYFFTLMEEQGFTLLVNYCRTKRRQRYRQTWLDINANSPHIRAK